MSASPRSFTAVVLAVIYLAALVVASPPSPHIIFIMVDDMGYNDVGYHSNGSVIETNNIDKLAGEGVKLESYYVAPLCTPSRSQFLTGRYLIHNRMQHLVIEPREPRCLPLNDTLANKLTDAGYATHLVGKWHLGYYKKECWPLNRGFQSFFGLLLGSGNHFSHKFTDPPTNQRKCKDEYFIGADLRDGETNVQPDYDGRHSTEIFTERAQDIIENHDQNEPMFLYLSYQAPHLPFEVPDEYSNYYKGKIQNNKNRRVYAGMVTMLDEAIGNLTKTLEERGMWNDTVLVFSTDNGGIGKRDAGNNWPLRGVKGNYFEGGIRGVGFVNSPLLSPSVRGTELTELMHISDWFPTLLEGVANVELDDDLELDGVNMWDIISQGTEGDSEREIVYNIDTLMTLDSVDSRYDDELAIFNVSVQAAIRKGDMKLMTGKQEDNKWYAPYESNYSDIESTSATGQTVWLFNITADPNEENDLSESMPDVVDRLLTRLQFFRTSGSFKKPENPNNDCDADPQDTENCGLWTNWGDPTPTPSC